TFSSLNKNFIEQYKGTMANADIPIVYYNPHTVEHKKLEPISKEHITGAFADNRIKIFTDSSALKDFLTNQKWEQSNLLMMSSGNFDGLSLEKLAEEII